MRLWPYQMLDVIPNQYLLGQWRECLAIAGMIAKHLNMGGEGKVNHATINRINKYPLEHFAAYCDLIIKEFKKRDFTIGTNAIEKLNNNIHYDKLKENYSLEVTEDNNFCILKMKDGSNQVLFKNFHDSRYIKQCCFMFQEKYDIDILDYNEYTKIYNKFCNLYD